MGTLDWDFSTIRAYGRWQKRKEEDAIEEHAHVWRPVEPYWNAQTATWQCAVCGKKRRN